MYYRLSSDSENFRNYILNETHTPSHNMEIYESFNATQQKHTYKPLEFSLTSKKESRYPIADFQGGYLPICSEKMKKILEEVCDENELEFLPCTLEGENGQFYILHILDYIDCIDYNKSKFTSFPSNPNKIMFFEHIDFKENVNRNIFRIKDLPYTYYFITEKLKLKLEEANLNGLTFSNAMFK